MDITLLKKCPLFENIEENVLPHLLDCLKANTKMYEQNDFIFLAGETFTAVGIVLSGGVHITQEDFWGNRYILANIKPVDLFGEAFSCAELKKLPVSVIASEKSEIMFIDYHRIITTCSSSCAFHTGLIQNMLRTLAKKNIFLTSKMENITKPSIKEKVLSYLSSLAVAKGTNKIEIPFNRQELADYLSIDRSALSRELSSMQKEGLLRYNKNEFILL